MLHVTVDNNEFLADGVTPNPALGRVTTETLPNPEPSVVELSDVEKLNAKIDAIAAVLNIDPKAVIASAQAAVANP